MLDDYIVEKSDYTRVKKLNALRNVNTFWDDVRYITRNVTSEHSLHRYEILSEVRFAELKGE